MHNERIRLKYRILALALRSRLGSSVRSFPHCCAVSIYRAHDLSGVPGRLHDLRRLHNLLPRQDLVDDELVVLAEKFGQGLLRESLQQVGLVFDRPRPQGLCRRGYRLGIVSGRNESRGEKEKRDGIGNQCLYKRMTPLRLRRDRRQLTVPSIRIRLKRKGPRSRGPSSLDPDSRPSMTMWASRAAPEKGDRDIYRAKLDACCKAFRTARSGTRVRALERTGNVLLKVVWPNKVDDDVDSLAVGLFLDLCPC